MMRGAAAIAGFLCLAGLLTMSRAAEAQCPNNSSIDTTDNLASTCYGTNSLVSATGVTFWNLAIGANTMTANTTGADNSALGALSLNANTTGNANTAVGAIALLSNSTGSRNTAVGFAALDNETAADGNTAIGWGASNLDASGAYNTAAGYYALGSNTTGGQNVALGSNALYADATGSNNVAVGSNALANQTGGSSNLVLGANAGSAYTGNESNDVLLANSGVAGESHVTRIGTANEQKKTFVSGIYGVTSSSGVPVYVTSAGQLIVALSSRRFKEEVADMGTASDELMRLRPVTYRYKAQYDDGQHLLQYGLIAEEVAEVDPSLVEYGQDGRPLTVRYHFVNAMLLGEVQRQHATIATQTAAIAGQKNEIASQKSEIEALHRTVAALAERLGKLEAAVSGH